MPKKKDIYVPTGVEVVNLILRILTTEFTRHDKAKAEVPTLLEQADKVVNEKQFFTYVDNLDG